MTIFQLYRSIATVVVCFALCGSTIHAQDLQNKTNGKVTNKGTIRFRSDTGSYQNSAVYTSNTNQGVIQFEGSNNTFTDLNGNVTGATALGINPAWRIPGLVRYKKDQLTQKVQARYFTNLEMADGANKNIPDSVFVAQEYTIVLSGPRQYNGTFYYDGIQQQYVTQENSLSGTVNRYNNLTILNGNKLVRGSDEVRMDGIFLTDASSALTVEGDFYWGTRSFVFAPITIQNGGLLTSGTDISDLHENVDILAGEFVAQDDADTIRLFAKATLSLAATDQAKLTMGRNTRMDVFGNYRNALSALTNATFEKSSIVHYTGVQQPQIMQATAPSHPYGNVITSASAKGANGNVFVASNLDVIDSNVTMIPYMMSLTLGKATYSNNAEVIGAFNRVLAGAAVNELYTYNNTETTFRFEILPQALQLDVRPQTRPNDFDPTTDINRKITMTHNGEWKATIRAGYKAEDIPPTWLPTTNERLLKMFNAYPAPNERSIKLAPTVPPTYVRKPYAQNSGLGYVELAGIQSSGADNTKLDNTNDILLRGSRDILKAISSGRWSNPDTWDEAREPEPTDRVQIDGFTVHVGYLRASDNYAIREAYPDSMALSVDIGTSEGTSLLFGSTNEWNTFSLVPEPAVRLVTAKGSPTIVPTLVQDVTAANLNAGLVVYPNSMFTTTSLSVLPNATVFNAGTLQVGTP